MLRRETVALPVPWNESGVGADDGRIRPSVRERDVIRLLVVGYSNDEMAFRLGISRKTVEFHLANLYRRYELPGRVSLAVMAIKKDWT